MLVTNGLVLLALGLTRLVSANSWKSSRTLEISGKPYYIPAEPVLKLDSSKFSLGDLDLLPVTVFSTTGDSVTGSKLKSDIEQWLKLDDVFDLGFLQGVLIENTGHGKSVLDQSAVKYLKGKGTKSLLLDGVSLTSRVQMSVEKLSKLGLPSGPYIITRGPGGVPAVYAAYRLFYDETQSFYKSMTLQSDGSFAVVSASLDTDSSPYIAVPSRAYATSADKSKKPLSGVRVTVKDIYHLKGLRTSAGNRHFYSTYGPRNVTGPAMSKLVDLGASLIGTTKTVQFANGDRATVDWVDYHAPFIVRADGNREPSGSSSGAGATLSAHDFVDVSIGSDTGGSVRGPAGVNGIYGIRPSVGAISLDEVVPLSDVLDTGGYLARDPKLFAAFGKAWYSGTFKEYPSFPSKLLLAGEFSNVTAPAAALYTDFIGKLSSFLNASVSDFSVAAAWNESSGTGVPITQFVNKTYPTLVAYHQWTAVGEKFFADYAAANGGRNPHINPSVLARWQYGIGEGAEGYATELKNRETFESWASSNFLAANEASCSENIYLYPQNAGSYTSRENYYPAIGTPPFGYSNGRIAVHARSPDLVIPIGQIPYNSTISGITEQLPVSISLVAGRGCDFMLLDLLDKLADAGLVQTSKTGRTAF